MGVILTLQRYGYLKSNMTCKLLLFIYLKKVCPVGFGKYIFQLSLINIQNGHRRLECTV